MRDKLYRNAAVAGLMLLAAVQGLALGLRQGPAAGAPDPWLGAGDGRVELGLLDGRGRPVAWPLGRPAVLLVFDPACVHCLDAARGWAGWIGEIPSGVRVLGVTDAPCEQGAAFLREQGLAVEVAQVAGGPPGGPAEALMRRTPWVFVVDRGAAILAQGHDLGLREILGVLAKAPGEGEEP